MRPRAIFMVALAQILLATALASAAQQPVKTPRIGLLRTGSPADRVEEIEAFRKGLGDLGYVEGQNIAIELRFAEGR